MMRSSPRVLWKTILKKGRNGPARRECARDFFVSGDNKTLSQRGSVLIGLGLGRYADISAPGAGCIKTSYFPFLEFDYAARKREKRVVFSAADVFSGADRSSALANNNHSGLGKLAVCDFYSEPLTVRVAAQRCGAAGFFVSHMLSY